MPEKISRLLSQAAAQAGKVLDRLKPARKSKPVPRRRIGIPIGRKSTDSVSNRLVVIDTVLAAGLPPDLTTALTNIADKIAPAEVPARIPHARQVADLCFAAKLRDEAVSYVALHTPIEVVRAQLIDAVADTGPEIITALPANHGAKRHWGAINNRY